MSALARVPFAALVGVLVFGCGSTAPTAAPSAGGPPASAAASGPVGAAPVPWDGLRLVDIGGGRHLELECHGTGTPVVILDAGLGNHLDVWETVIERVSAFTTVCAYNRAGQGREPFAVPPHGAERGGRPARAPRRTAGLPPPYVVGGASFGGLVAQLFARDATRRRPRAWSSSTRSPPVGTRSSRPSSRRPRWRSDARSRTTRTSPTRTSARAKTAVGEAPPFPPVPLVVLHHGIPFPGGTGLADGPGRGAVAAPPAGPGRAEPHLDAASSPRRAATTSTMTSRTSWPTRSTRSWTRRAGRRSPRRRRPSRRNDAPATENSGDDQGRPRLVRARWHPHLRTVTGVMRASSCRTRTTRWSANRQLDAAGTRIAYDAGPATQPPRAGRSTTRRAKSGWRTWQRVRADRVTDDGAMPQLLARSGDPSRSAASGIKYLRGGERRDPARPRRGWVRGLVAGWHSPRDVYQRRPGLRAAACGRPTGDDLRRCRVRRADGVVARRLDHRAPVHA